jgi:hypothetical protein
MQPDWCYMHTHTGRKIIFGPIDVHQLHRAKAAFANPVIMRWVRTDQVPRPHKRPWLEKAQDPNCMDLYVGIYDEDGILIGLMSLVQSENPGEYYVFIGGKIIFDEKLHDQGISRIATIMRYVFGVDRMGMLIMRTAAVFTNPKSYLSLRHGGCFLSHIEPLGFKDDVTGEFFHLLYMAAYAPSHLGRSIQVPPVNPAYLAEVKLDMRTYFRRHEDVTSPSQLNKLLATLDEINVIPERKEMGQKLNEWRGLIIPMPQPEWFNPDQQILVA